MPDGPSEKVFCHICRRSQDEVELTTCQKCGKRVCQEHLFSRLHYCHQCAPAHKCPECLDKQKQIYRYKELYESAMAITRKCQNRLEAMAAIGLRVESAQYAPGAVLVISLDGEELGRLFLNQSRELRALKALGELKGDP